MNYIDACADGYSLRCSPCMQYDTDSSNDSNRDGGQVHVLKLVKNRGFKTSNFWRVYLIVSQMKAERLSEALNLEHKFFMPWDWPLDGVGRNFSDTRLSTAIFLLVMILVIISKPKRIINGFYRNIY